jgi:hypothetical protein
VQTTIRPLFTHTLLSYLPGSLSEKQTKTGAGNSPSLISLARQPLSIIYIYALVPLHYPPFTGFAAMSVITATSVPFGNMPASEYEQQQYAMAIEDISPRRSSAASTSSYSSNYNSSYSSTPPTVYSPTSPRSPLNRPSKQHIAPPPTPTIPTSFLPRQPYEPALGSLPPAVYNCILNQLQDLHEAPENYQYGCTTCFQRDLHALALTSRTWERAVRSKLYNSPPQMYIFVYCSIY